MCDWLAISLIACLLIEVGALVWFAVVEKISIIDQFIILQAVWITTLALVDIGMLVALVLLCIHIAWVMLLLHGIWLGRKYRKG